MWSAFGLIVVGIALFFVLILNGAIGYIPDIDELENPIDKYASQVFSADGKLLFTYSLSNNNRIFVDYSELSPHLIDALISTEDIRFHAHSGIDARGLMRAIIKTGILRQAESGGGSTISQQLAKLLYTERARNRIQRIAQKPIEWVIAVKLERFYSKEEIINLYLNMYDFNYNAVGIESAARTYFNAIPNELKIEEAATLVGMLKNSSLYNPIRRPEMVLNRRNVVLSQMQKAGHITRQEFDSLRQLPLETDFNRSGHVDIAAPYFRQTLMRILTAQKPDRRNYPHAWQQQQFFEDSLSWENDLLFGWANKNRKPDGTPYNIFTDGLRIHVTLDSRMQRYAEEAVAEHLGKTLQPQFFRSKANQSWAPYARQDRDRVDGFLETAARQTDRFRHLRAGGMSDADILKHFREDKVDMQVFSWEHREVDTIMTPMDSIRYQKSFLRAGFMAMDPFTGHVKAYVGGPDFKFFQFDMVRQGKRQIGSTAKPFLYTLAMEEGLTPCDVMFHQQVSLQPEVGEPWEPRNAGTAARNEYVTLQWGLQNSDNWVTAWLMGALGETASPFALSRMLASFGLRTPAEPVLSTSLGSNDASVFEMVGAYTAFVNQGTRTEPVLVTRIESAHGQELFSAFPQPIEVFSERTAYTMIGMLRGAIDGGTGGRLRRIYGLRGEMGGKTGTTNNNSDGWFMSFTPTLVAGAWVGGEEMTIRFDNITHGQGASMALPIHGLFYQKVFADPNLPYKDDGRFVIPSGFNPCAGARPNTSDGHPQSQEERREGIDNMFN
jgi:penicillin-binding protein 1A